MGAGNLNPGPHARAASASSMEPFPQKDSCFPEKQPSFERTNLVFFRHCRVNEILSIYDDIWILKYFIWVGEMVEQLRVCIIFCRGSKFGS